MFRYNTCGVTNQTPLSHCALTTDDLASCKSVICRPSSQYIFVFTERVKLVDT